MFDFKTTFRLLCACATCLGILWAFDHATPEPHGTHNGRLLGFNMTDADQLLIERNDGRIIELRQQRGEWRLVRPRAAMANDETVRKALDELERATIIERIDSHDLQLRDLSHGDFGLTPPKGRVIVRGTRFRAEILYGDYDAATNGVFVKFEPGIDVFVTSPSLRSLLSLSDRDFADRRLFPSDMRLVKAIVIRSQETGDLKLVRSGRFAWTITQPVEAPADWDTVARFMDILSSSTSLDFARAGAPLSMDPASATTIRLFAQNDVAGHSVMIGGHVPGEVDHAYAQDQDGAVVVVTGALRRAAMMTAYDFRSRRLFPSSSSRPVKALTIETPSASITMRRGDGGDWSLTTPVAAPAEPDAIAALVDSILSLSAERLVPTTAWDAPDVRRLASVAVAYGEERVAFDILENPGEARWKVALAREGETMLFLVEPSAVEGILAACAYPRAVVSRTMIDLDPDAVRTVTISHGGEVQESAERLAGEWTSATPGRKLDSGALMALLAAVRPLRAASVVSAERDEDPFPADDTLVIAFGFADGATLRRSIVVGAPAGDGSRQAYVTGSDILFSLASETAAALARPILMPDTPKVQGDGTANTLQQLP